MRWEDYEFEARLGYIVRPVSNNNKKTQKTQTRAGGRVA
jgi:hypothetical protein